MTANVINVPNKINEQLLMNEQIYDTAGIMETWLVESHVGYYIWKSIVF